MKLVLAAMNAKYIHTNLAVRYLDQMAKNHSIDGVSFVEYTINQHLPQLLRELFLLKADYLIFSCYLWNISQVLELCQDLKKIAPKTCLILAGPEVSYHGTDLLKEHPFLDMILCGEGEPAWLPFLNACQKTIPFSQVPGLALRTPHGIVQTPSAPAFDLSDLPFPYDDLDALENRILYFEASRGCPFQCSYCLSSHEEKVRFMPLPQLFLAMDRFLSHRVKQVKFVDRTFNCNKPYAMTLWKYLAEHDNGITNFHFEIAGDLLDTDMLSFLSTVRKGLFQFEVGVQSTNPLTLAGITRKTHLKKLFANCRAINERGNLHLHLDLIAGLPFDTLQTFARSFNEVFALRPQQLQLGFLKLLKGSKIRGQAPDMQISYSERPPYEVLCTQWLPFSDMLILKEVEEMVDTFYNSGRFANILEAILPKFPSAFAFFCGLGAYYTKHGHHLIPHSKERHYEILRSFCLDAGLGFPTEWEQLCLLDLCLHEKPKKLPAFLPSDVLFQHRTETTAFYESPEQVQRYLPAYTDESPRRLAKITHLQWFPFVPVPTGLPNHTYTLEAGQSAILFDYAPALRSITGRAAMQVLPL